MAKTTKIIKELEDVRVGIPGTVIGLAVGLAAIIGLPYAVVKQQLFSSPIAMLFVILTFSMACFMVGFITKDLISRIRKRG